MTFNIKAAIVAVAATFCIITGTAALAADHHAQREARHVVNAGKIASAS